MSSLISKIKSAFYPKDPRFVFDGNYESFQNCCPRNCYDTCSIVSQVKDGRLEFIEGNTNSTYTDGGLCVKGYSYPELVYSPDRIKYPMRQNGRGSGKWERISWEEAIDIFAKKIMEIRQKDHSLHGFCLNKYSGNLSVNRSAIDGFMSSLGPVTKMTGGPCWPAGFDAQCFDMGEMWCDDPETLKHSKFIILWGVNPAWCSVHTMKYIYEAQANGAEIIVIDPILTQTAAKADQYIRIKTGEDGALALAMIQHILAHDLDDKTFIDQNTFGFEKFKNYLDNHIRLEECSERTGIPSGVIQNLAEKFARADVASIWMGFGMQRHTNGGANIRAIDALVAITGNIGKYGGGARYAHLKTRTFNYALNQFSFPNFNFRHEKDRIININKFAGELNGADDPPVRLLWIACKNPVSQDFGNKNVKEAMKNMELNIVSDLFFTQTTEWADLILPVTTPFEELTINSSYWHYWVGINEPAIQPYFEAKADPEVCCLLSAKLNSLLPGSCTFPQKYDPESWLDNEFNDETYLALGIKHWKELKQGPKKSTVPPTAWSDYKFKTESGKYEFYSNKAETFGHNPLPIYQPPVATGNRYRLLTPHSRFGINSQFQNQRNMMTINPEPVIHLSPEIGKKEGIRDGDQIVVKNETGEMIIKAKLDNNIPLGTVVIYTAWYLKHRFNIQKLVNDTASDMGQAQTGAPGVAIHDQFVMIEKLSSGNLRNRKLTNPK